MFARTYILVYEVGVPVSIIFRYGSSWFFVMFHAVAACMLKGCGIMVITNVGVNKCRRRLGPEIVTYESLSLSVWQSGSPMVPISLGFHFPGKRFGSSKEAG